MKHPLAAILLSLALILTSTLLIVQWRRASAAEHTLQETYLSALGESSELLESLSLDLEKVLISHDAAHSAELLGRISRDAGDVRRSLAFLPLSQEELVPAMTFTEELAERSSSLISTLVRDGRLPDPQRAALENDLTHCVLLSGHLSTARQEVLEGRLSLTQAASDAPAPTSPPVTQLPAAKGLPRTEVTAGQAMTIAGQFVGLDRVTDVSSAPDLTGGSIPAWGVAVHTNDVLLNMEITRIGGKVLMMSPETASFAQIRTAQECIHAAAAFLESREFGSMESIWSQSYDGMCVVTFASVQEGVRIYPDLVTVQVRMDTAEVVGLEAHNYWMNHTPRRISSPVLTLEDARLQISPGVTEQSARLCIIPDNGTETLCWEFTVTRGDETYLIYIDAQTGREAALQKIVMLENGETAA